MLATCGGALSTRCASQSEVLVSIHEFWEMTEEATALPLLDDTGTILSYKGTDTGVTRTATVPN